MKVRVKKDHTGYFGDVRRRAGETFNMPDENVLPLDDNGKPLLDAKGRPRVCAWAEPVNPADLEKLLAKHGFKMKLPVAAPVAKPSAQPELKAEAEDEDDDKAL